MNCRSVIEFLTDYLEGRLPLGQRLLFGLHLLCCGSCRNYLHNFQSAIQAGKQACQAAADESEIPEELVQAILRTQGK